LIEDPAVALKLSDAISGAPSRRWRDLRDRLASLENLPPALEEQLAALDRARRGKVEVHLDLYGDDEGQPRGVVFVARLGLKDVARRQGQDDGRLAATEDDTAGSLAGFRQTLDEHSGEVASKADAFARSAGLSMARIADLALAGYLHDAGKADPRFQAWLYGGDPLGADPDLVLAKSGRPLPRDARERSGLPDNWRHEALSVRIATLHPRFAQANDPELVLWLVGTHHGYGRPLFPHADPCDAQVRELPPVLGQQVIVPAGAGPQSLAYDYDGSDWACLFARLKARYGVWELARMEAILRLADHRASEEAERRAVAGEAA
jgi:CRISPR-associated endonuclease/helicase Cas3